MAGDYLFTSESVSEGHPDKVADQISDGVLDAILEQDPHARVAAETLVTTGLVVLAGEITTVGERRVLRTWRAKSSSASATTTATRHRLQGLCGPGLLRQAEPGHRAGRRRRQGPGPGPGRRRPGPDVRLCLRRDARADAGCRSIYAHRLVERQAELRRDGRLPWLRPDAKSQVTLRYVDGKPHRSTPWCCRRSITRTSSHVDAGAGRDRGDRQAGAAQGLGCRTRAT